MNRFRLLRAVLSVLACAAQGGLAAAQGSDEAFRDWRVYCEASACNAYQVGIGGRQPTTLRVLTQSTGLQLVVEGDLPTPEATLTFVIDGRTMDGLRVGSVASGQQRRAVLWADERTNRLIQSMRRGQQLNLAIGFGQSEQVVRFPLHGFAAAIGRLLSAQRPDAIAIDSDMARRRLGKDERLETLALDDKGRVRVSGEVTGNQTTVYALAAKAGRSVSILMETTNRFLYFDLRRADTGATIFNSSTGGGTNPATSVAAKSWVGTLPAEGTYLIRPFLFRNAAREGQVAPYEFGVSVR